MKTEIETAIKHLATKAKEEMKPDDAMKVTQAALNMAHVLATISNLPRN